MPRSGLRALKRSVQGFRKPLECGTERLTEVTMQRVGDGAITFLQMLSPAGEKIPLKLSFLLYKMPIACAQRMFTRG